MALTGRSAAGKILHNSFWYGLETMLETVVFLGTSVAVARYLGPEKLGYFTYVNFFVTIVTRTSGTGLANATRKYMSEFLALDQPGTARAVYHLAYRYQLLGAVTITALGLGSVALFGDPHYRAMSSILILSIVPGIMSWVPAHANQAFEDVSKNTFSALCYLLSYSVVIILTVWLHWDLIGIASALLVGRTVEVVIRTIPLHRRLRELPLDPLSDGVVQRIRRFCLEAVGIQLLMSVVWDRSEMIFLRAFCGLEQIAFYSISFGLANNLLVIPRTFGSAAGITLMLESGRDVTRIRGIVDNTARYLLLVVFPVHLGAAAITRQAIGFAYGVKYTGAVWVLVVAAILAIPRAFQEIPEVLMRAADRQRRLLLWLSLTGAVNIALDWILIPRYGAIGAALGNGLSQGFGVAMVWQQAGRFYPFSFPWNSAVRLFLAGLVMAAVAWETGRLIHGPAGMVVAIAVAAPVYVLLVKLFRGLQASDRVRLAPIGNRLPLPLRGAYQTVIAFVTPLPMLP